MLSLFQSATVDTERFRDLLSLGYCKKAGMTIRQSTGENLFHSTEVILGKGILRTILDPLLSWNFLYLWHYLGAQAWTTDFNFVEPTCHT